MEAAGDRTVLAIHVAKGRRLPMNSVEVVEAEAGRGLVGDRYHGSKHRHVSVQSADSLAEAADSLGRDVPPELTRRNLTLSGPEVPHAPGTRFRVGPALLEVVRVAAPCKLLDDNLGPGAQGALRRRAGVICRVLEPGSIRVGDPVTTHPVTRVTQRIEATPAQVYAALLDPGAVERWRVPDDMTATVHELEAVEGGRSRVTLAYDDPTAVGKTEGHTDTYTATYLRLVPDREVVEAIRFETGDDAVAGEMLMTTTIRPVGEACEVTIDHRGLPAGLDPTDNETGTRMALEALAQLVEGRA